jgi:hypothetical protein
MLNEQTFTTLFFAQKAKDLKVVNGTNLKALFRGEAKKAFKEYRIDNSPKKSTKKVEKKED